MKIHRSRRANAIEHLRSWFGYYPYRCSDCKARIYLKRVADRPASAPDSVDRRKAIERRRHKWMRTRREVMLYGAGVMLFAMFLYWVTRERSGGGEG